MDDAAIFNHPLFHGCAAETMRDVAAMGERLVYPRGALILHQGDRAEHIYLLLAGVVRVLITNEQGQQVTPKLFPAPAVFGEMETLTRDRFIESVDVLRQATVLRFTAAAFDEVMAREGKITRNLLVDVCQRFCISARNEAFTATESVERRLANLLLSYARSLGTPVSQGIQLVAQGLTQQAMANGIGVNEKSVRRTLRDWQRRGLLVREGRSYVLQDPEALAALSGAEPPRLDHTSKRR